MTDLSAPGSEMNVDPAVAAHTTGEPEPHDTGPPETDLREWVGARLPALLRYAHILTGDRHQAEDIVQTAVARTLAAWPRVRRKHDPEAYVRQAIVRLVLNSRRRAWRERLTGSPPEPAAAPPTGPEDRMAMWAALATLPPRQRAVVVLRYYEDLSEARIAEVLGCSPGTVKSQSARALARLRTHFEASREKR